MGKAGLGVRGWGKGETRERSGTGETARAGEARKARWAGSRRGARLGFEVGEYSGLKADASSLGPRLCHQAPGCSMFSEGIGQGGREPQFLKVVAICDYLTLSLIISLNMKSPGNCLSSGAFTLFRSLNAFVEVAMGQL